MRGVAVFDIDGTLTNTFAVDIECYDRAVRELLGFRVPADWADQAPGRRNPPLEAGARVVIPDFRDANAVLALL